MGYVAAVHNSCASIGRKAKLRARPSCTMSVLYRISISHPPLAVLYPETPVGSSARIARSGSLSNDAVTRAPLRYALRSEPLGGAPDMLTAAWEDVE